MSIHPEVRAALWTMAGIFVVFKVATTILIVMASPDLAHATLALFVAFHWPFILGALVFAAVPAAFWFRLIRVRAKRARLQAAEWRTD
jgi:hypothetical protein